MISNIVKTMAVVGAVALSSPAFAGGPLIGAASEATAVAGAGAIAGGGGGGSASQSQNDKTKTIAGAVGFPSLSVGTDCVLFREGVWNFVAWTTDSPRCVENDETDAMMSVLTNIGDTPGAELTGAQLAALNRVAMMSEKNCKALTSAKDIGGFITCDTE